MGAAYEAFVLPPKVPLAGYSKRHGKPSTGVRDPVGVRALVVSDGETTAALVSADLLIVDERLADAVRQRLLAQGIPRSLTLLLAATHTHSGPGAYGRRFLEQLSMGHFDARVFDAIVDATARAVMRAQAALAPVHVGVQRVETTGLIENRMVPGGRVDAALTVVTYSRPDARDPLAIVISFAAHPTALGAWNTRLSGDYPGVVMREVTQRFPRSVALFFAGAVGDQAPVKLGDREQRAERLGVPLAEQVLALLPAKTPSETPDRVRAAQALMPLPAARVRLGRLRLPSWLGRGLVDDDATLTVVRVGTTVFMGAPCDLTTELGAQLQAAARARGLQPVVVGFANDYIGYCVPAALYQQRQYETTMAFNGPRTGELVVERTIHLLDEVR